MPKANIGPRIDADVKRYYAENFKNPNAGAVYALEMFPALFRQTLLELKGQFSENELSLLVDVMNVEKINPTVAGQYLLTNVKPRIDLDALDETWQIEKDSFLQKITKLTCFQAACLELFANRYWWDEQLKVRSTKTLKKYLKPLLK